MHTNRRFQLDAEGLAGVMGSLDHIVDIAGFGMPAAATRVGRGDSHSPFAAPKGHSKSAPSNQLYMGFDWVY